MNTRTILPGIAATLLAVGCGDASPAASGGNARLSIYLTDAPGDVDRAWIEIEEVSFRAQGERLTFVPESQGLIEVTDLVDDVHLLVGEEEVEVGSLNEVRIVIGDALLESKDGTVYVLGDPDLPEGVGEPTGDLHCPSCQQSGIKIKVSNDELELPEGEHVLLLDFDVSQTFGHRAGNSGRWIMHPVVHADLFAEELIGTATDDLAGVVVATVPIPDCPAGTPRSIEDFVPVATAQTLVDGDGETIVRTAVVSPLGAFSIGGMEADTYSLGYRGTLDLGTDVLTFQAAVVPSEVTIVGDAGVGAVAYTVTGATCSPAS